MSPSCMRAEAASVHAYFFCKASLFAPLYACAYVSGLPAFVRTFVLGKLRSATCTAHVYACVAAGVHRYFRKFRMLSTQRGYSFDGREVLVPFDRYAVLTVIRPTLCLFGHFSITKRGSPQKIQNGRPVMLKLSHAYS